MASKMLIVESPAKAKTIEKYLGGDFIVKSSVGHIRDLDKGKKGVNIEEEFEPKYVVTPEKEKVVKDLKATQKKVDEVWLATDEDREGEAISWHLCKVLDLDAKTTKRIVFREITKTAIQKAVQEPRTVDLNLVDAQQARRILDRLVGFELSEVLWRKIRTGLSAGRVQSVTVKLVVEREREINKFTAEPFYKVSAIFNVLNDFGKQVELKAELAKRLETVADAKSFLEKSNGAGFKIGQINVKPLKRKPSAPFTTSTLQQDASRKIGFSVQRTMSTAQRLYEQGLITYMRTDSTTLSDTAIKNIGDEIISKFGEKYHKTRQFKSKKENVQEAHEAIRPSYIDRREVSSDSDQQRLYDLIWKRTIASQMAEAELEKTTVLIDISTIDDAKLQATGEVLKFDGFLKVYIASSEDDEEQNEAKGILPPLKVGQDLDLHIMEGVERFTRPPARFTEASLVKKLEELGIGRPSTYAPTVGKIMDKKRGYVTKESRDGKERKYAYISLSQGVVKEEVKTEMTGATSNRLYPSDLGMIVCDFLSENFEEIMNYRFTADIEARLDHVADGEGNWKEMLREFYDPFIKDVTDTKENAARAKGTRILGKDPESGHTVLAQITRYGPVIQIGTVEEVGEEGKPKFANLNRDQSIETINYEDAMELFKLPLSLGDYKGHEMVVTSGPYGPYIKYDGKSISLPRGRDPLTFPKSEAEELVDAKLKELAPVAHFEDLPVTQGKGRFGPFLKWNGFFINIPKRFDPENLSPQDIVELIEAKKEKEANRFVKRFVEEGVDIENGRWGPFVRYKKKSFKIPKKESGERFTSEEALEFDLEKCISLIEEGGGTYKPPKKKKAPKAKKVKEAKK